MVIAIPFFDMDLYLCVRNIGVNDVLINHYIYYLALKMIACGYS